MTPSLPLLPWRTKGGIEGLLGPFAEGPQSCEPEVPAHLAVHDLTCCGSALSQVSMALQMEHSLV